MPNRIDKIILDKPDVNLPNVDNTSDVNKPISTAQATALAAKVDKTTTVNGKALSGNISITANDVGLGNVNNTSDANKPVSTAQATAIAAKVDKTTTVNGKALSGNISITANDVGLGNVNNTSDANKPVSTAQAAAIDSAITAHESKAGSHQISGVAGLAAELDELKKFVPKKRVSSPSWWINPKTLRFLTMYDLGQAAGVSGTPSDNDLQPYIFDVVLDITCPGAGVWNHHYSFSIHRPVKTNDGTAYPYSHYFTGHTTANRGEIYVQTVPNTENSGLGYWELRMPVDVQGVSGLVVSCIIYARRVY